MLVKRFEPDVFYINVSYKKRVFQFGILGRSKLANSLTIIN